MKIFSMPLSREYRIAVASLGIVCILSIMVSIMGWLHERQWGLMAAFYANVEWMGEPAVVRREPSPVLQESPGIRSVHREYLV